jgi:4-hydroxy-tetrahydrodipicolinate synthase
MGRVINDRLSRLVACPLAGLRGSVTALVTPFKNGRLDEESFEFLCHRQIERGTAGLVPSGTTGEASTLTHGEQHRVIELAVKAAKGRVPVIAGAGSNCTRTAVDLAMAAERLGADAVLSVVPYYNRPTQEGLYQHFKTIQSTTTLPVLVYDVPARTGVGLTTETIERLVGLPNIVGLKDASGDIKRGRELRWQLPSDFLLLCGDDTNVAGYLAFGSQGCISVVSNVAPALCAALHRAWADRDMAQFDYLRGLLDPLTRALFVETNPIPVKWALARLGLISNEVRLPLTRLAPDRQLQVDQVLDAVVDAEAAQAARVVAAARAGDLQRSESGRLSCRNPDPFLTSN